MGIDKELGPGLDRPGLVEDAVRSCSPDVTTAQAAITEAVKVLLDAILLKENEIAPDVIPHFESLLQAFAILGLGEGTDFTHSILNVPLSKNIADQYSVFRIGKYKTTILVCRNKKCLTYIVRHIVEDHELPISRSKFPRDESESDGYIAFRLLSAPVYYWRICEIVSGGKITYFTDLRKVRSEIKAFAKSIDLPEGDFEISISAAGRASSAAGRARAMTGYGEEISFLSYLKRYRKSLGKNGDWLDDQSLRDDLLSSVGLLSKAKILQVVLANNPNFFDDCPGLDDVDLDLGLYDQDEVDEELLKRLEKLTSQ